MSSTLRFLGANNGYIPEATGMIISWVKKPETFKHLKYIELVPADKPTGLYSVMERDHPVRAVNLTDIAWPDGHDRPIGQGNLTRWREEEFRTQRRNLAFQLGWQANQNAVGWEPIAYEAMAQASQMMTIRTQLIINMLETTSNWGSDNTADANTLNEGAGKWIDGGTGGGSDDPNSPRYLAIKKAISKALVRIKLMTNSIVTSADLRMVISPDDARGMSITPEFVNYLRESPFAMAQVKGNEPGPNSEYGLPSHYAGVELVVEDATRVLAEPNSSGTETALASGNRKFIKSTGSAVIMSRPGALDGVAGKKSYSTVQLYHHDGLLQIEAFDDKEHRKTRGHCTEQVAIVMPAPQAGFLITNIS